MFYRCKVIPAVNQIEFNPYLVDKDILDVCKEHKIIVQAYAPIGGGSRKIVVGPSGGPSKDENIDLGKRNYFTLK